MLINNLRNHKELSHFIRDKCDDSKDSKGNFKVIIDKSVKPKNILIIKVDLYFNKEISPNPKGPDCLIIQRCAKNEFDIYVVELKDVKRPKGIDKKNIQEKFINCYDLFIKKEFKKYVDSNKIKIRNIKLWLIADPFNIREHPERKKYNNVIDFKQRLGDKPVKYFNNHLFINYDHKNPTIKDCLKIRAS